MRRCLSWILVILLLQAMIVPASASEAKNYVDLMAMGYFYVNGSPNSEFTFVSSGNDHIQFPVDAIGGMGDVEIVLQCGSDVLIKSASNVILTKSALGIANTVWYTKDLEGETEENFNLSSTAGTEITIISAKAYYPSSLSVALPFDSIIRIGTFREELTDIETLLYRMKSEDFIDSTEYTTYVSERLAFDPRDLAGLDSIDLTIYVNDMAFNSISAYSASNVYVPVSYSMYSATDPAVERSRVVIHMDISNVPYNEWIYLYVYGITTSSSDLLVFNIPQVMGYIARPGTSGDVGLLFKIWSVLTDTLSYLKTYISGDSEISNKVEDQVNAAATEASEQLEVMDSVTKPDVEELDDIADISGYVDSGGVGVLATTLSPLFESDVFKPIIMLSLTFMLISYVLFGKR